MTSKRLNTSLQRANQNSSEVNPKRRMVIQGMKDMPSKMQERDFNFGKLKSETYPIHSLDNRMQAESLFVPLPMDSHDRLMMFDDSFLMEDDDLDLEEDDEKEPEPEYLECSQSSQHSSVTSTKATTDPLIKPSTSFSDMLSGGSSWKVWPPLEEIILVGCVVLRFLSYGSLTSSTRERNDCWDTIKANYDQAWKIYCARTNHPVPQDRTKTALKRHYKVMKERITRNQNRDTINFYTFFERFEALGIELNYRT